MLLYEEALQNLLSRVPKPAITEVPLLESLGAVLARDVVADLDLPPFHKSSMDGYAFRTADLPGGTGHLPIAGVVAAGVAEPPRLEAGRAWQIMTGAPVPEGADAVQMVEKTHRDGPDVEILEGVAPGENISPRGNEVKRGSVALAAGRPIGPQEIAVLATFGRTSVPIFKRPSAAIVSTGDELVSIDQSPRFGQIRNSNAYMLAAQCQRLGLKARRLPAVSDDRARIREAIEDGLRDDLLIFSGGVSMGEFDHVHTALRDFGVEIFFHKAAIKPGKPLIVGEKGGRMVFGLPGNPVSSFVTFEVFVKPAVRRWTGLTAPSPAKVRGRISRDIHQNPGRLFFMPAQTLFTPTGFICQPLETKGSADIVAFSKADSMLLFPAESGFLAKGETVDIILLEDRGGLRTASSRGFDNL